MLVKLLIPGVVLAACGSLFSDPASTPAPPASAAILVFYKTAGFHHKSIPDGLRALQKLGKDNGFRVDTTANNARFAPAQLTAYQAVVFLNTTADVLTAPQQTAFEQYIRAGHGYVGIHAASDTEYDWPWYHGLVGAYFVSHPAVQPATIRIQAGGGHPATAGLPAAWPRTDEWYNFRDIKPDLTVLATLDETTYTGGTNGPTHPFAWYHTYDGGRAFYTAGGHTPESYQEPLFLRHLLGGIQYAIGR
ncbi:ThuA domain-containing protein [Hymenobacter lucidus]|uniref:ThuA domain-containing protein n=1 Tax=Hymenobacter lucidus TaxID=2880930 RepID=A0ABS8AVI7_9BACT|nr:ThuA domain-containing protein [Hymenobacter lucidus]MCB2408846.1 ThuA domain-containing protein [Hymenobacter lucidus]